jgi:hypothetical protein
MADTRYCERCGLLFEPRREHARFCSSRCRVAWNRDSTSDRRAEDSALGWSVIAMRDTTSRLARVRARDRPQAFAVISEAVWWVTIVDATLVRYHPDAYDAAMTAEPAGNRKIIEDTFTGLRFVRNWMGFCADPSDFIEPHYRADGSDDARVAKWTWLSIPEPELDLQSERGQVWEMNRYAAYEAQLAGHTVGDVFTRASEFLALVLLMR